MISPISKVPATPPSSGGYTLNVDFFRSDKATNIADIEIGSEPAKKGRPKKTKSMSDGSEMVPAYDSKLSQTQSNEAYLSTYAETNNLLKGAIVEIDMLNNDIKQELNIIKGSKTLKGKYTYMSELTSTSGTLIGQKLTAIRELNSSITKSHDLDLKRTKELNLADAGVSDDMKIMDMYNAFISTPIGDYTPQLAPSLVDMSMPSNGMGMIRTEITQPNDYGYQNHVNNMTPEQNRMRMEKNPNVKTVVCYNQENGQKWFDTIDTTTGQSIPNMPLPDQAMLEDTNINLNAGVARNSNIDSTYPLIVVGQRTSVLDY